MEMGQANEIVELNTNKIMKIAVEMNLFVVEHTRCHTIEYGQLFSTLHNSLRYRTANGIFPVEKWRWEYELDRFIVRVRKCDMHNVEV